MATSLYVALHYQTPTQSFPGVAPANTLPGSESFASVLVYDRLEVCLGELSVAKEKWYRAGLAFECMQCGSCCGGAPGYVWVTKKDIKTIARFLGRTDNWLPKTQLRRVGFRYSLTEQANGDCVFLKREGERIKCSIYSVRPLQCRTWPFWTSNLTSADAWNRATETCPGINLGRRYDFEAIEKIRTSKPQ